MFGNNADTRKQYSVQRLSSLAGAPYCAAAPAPAAANAAVAREQ